MASLQGEFAPTVVTGLRRREAIVAPEKASWDFVLVERRRPLVLGVSGGVGGRRSFAASQSSSTNYFVSVKAQTRRKERLERAERTLLR
jgi:hypothetical protein